MKFNKQQKSFLMKGDFTREIYSLNKLGLCDLYEGLCIFIRKMFGSSTFVHFEFTPIETDTDNISLDVRVLMHSSREYCSCSQSTSTECTKQNDSISDDILDFEDDDEYESLTKSLMTLNSATVDVRYSLIKSKLDELCSRNGFTFSDLVVSDLAFSFTLK